MAILGVALVTNIDVDATDTFKADIRVVTNDGTSQGNFTATGLPVSGLTQIVFDAALKTAVKNYMINNLGFTFGLLDTVKLVGSSVI